MSKLIRAITLLLSLVIFVFTLACSPVGSVKDFYYFNTIIHVETHQTTLSNQTIRKLDQLFSNIESTFDPQKQGSFTYEYNQAEVNSQITCSPSVKEIIDSCLEYYHFTDGLFNPSALSLFELWQFSPDYPILNFTPPSEEQIHAVISNDALNFENIFIANQNHLILKANENQKLDFGGMLKGYACDKASEILLEDGHSAGYISVGGSSMFLLNVESLGIKHPRANGKIISINIDTPNLAVSTSGDYERYYIYDGNRYSHVINPLTGYPSATGVASVTILGAPSAFADAITTAMCLCSNVIDGQGQSELLKLINKVLVFYPDTQIYAVTVNGQDKQILTNKKQGEDFTLLDADFSVVNF